MCTIILLNGVRDDAPLVIAANRDEYRRRPWRGPEVLTAAPRIVGGRDIDRGGTWLALRADGYFAAVTNHRTHRPADASRSSRGHVVLDVLACGGVEAMTTHVSALDGSDFNPFNLAFGHAGDVRVAYARGERAAIDVHTVPRGVHVLTNDVLDSPSMPKVFRTLDAVLPARDAPWPELEASLRTALADHTLPPIERIAAPPDESMFTRETLQSLQCVCVHLDGYGTVCATIARLTADRVVSYAFAAGAPCTTPWQDFTDLARP